MVPASGGNPKKIAEFGDRPQWSPAGNLILFSNATVRTGTRKLYVVDAAGGVPREVCQDAIAPLISTAWRASVEARLASRRPACVGVGTGRRSLDICDRPDIRRRAGVVGDS